MIIEKVDFGLKKCNHHTFQVSRPGFLKAGHLQTSICLKYLPYPKANLLLFFNKILDKSKTLKATLIPKYVIYITEFYDH